MGLRRLRLALVVSWWAVGDGFFVARAAPSTRVARCACDEAMYDTYDALAARCVALVEAQAGGGGVWIGIAGGPGAGKSTVAEAVAARAAKKGVASVVLPMDGFHYSKAELRGLDPPDAARYLPRRGAPWTFDAARFCRDLRRAKANERASWPTYSRVLSDPVAGGADYDGEALILCEGNYLLLGALADRGDLDPDVRAEAARWRPLLDGACFDETWPAAARRELRFASTFSKRPPRGNRGPPRVGTAPRDGRASDNPPNESRKPPRSGRSHPRAPRFVAPAGGVPAQRDRLVNRHLETWTDAKTEAWGAATPLEGAQRRTDANDVPNAYLVDECRSFADLLVTSLGSAA